MERISLGKSPPQNEAEHNAQVEARLSALDGEQKKKDTDNDNALTAEQAEAVAQKIKTAYPVFKSITPVAKDERWMFRYTASPEKEVAGYKIEQDNGELLKTKVDHDGDHGDSLWVEANPLTKTPGNTTGNEPKESCPGWDYAQDLNRVQDTWVKGHLLNHHLHGPGLKWNLVPLTKKNNSAMAMGPEELAKTKVFKENRTLHYKTTVTFHNGEAALKYFPAKLVVTLSELKGSEATNRKTFTFTQDKPAATADEVVYNLNEIGRDTLREKFKIPEIFAKEIIDVKTRVIKRKFKNIDDLFMVMFNYYSNKLDTKTTFTKNKLNSFEQDFNRLHTSILKEKRLIIE